MARRERRRTPGSAKSKVLKGPKHAIKVKIFARPEHRAKTTLARKFYYFAKLSNFVESI
jgi:hypothetical protein